MFTLTYHPELGHFFLNNSSLINHTSSWVASPCFLNDTCRSCQSAAEKRQLVVLSPDCSPARPHTGSENETGASQVIWWDAIAQQGPAYGITDITTCSKPYITSILKKSVLNQCINVYDSLSPEELIDHEWNVYLKKINLPRAGKCNHNSTSEREWTHSCSVQDLLTVAYETISSFKMYLWVSSFKSAFKYACNARGKGKPCLGVLFTLL